MTNHTWVPSTFGHGEAMCKYCFITNREAAVLGQLNECKKAPPPEPPPKWTDWTGEGPAPAKWYATNPETGERTLIYRSYADYCDD